MLDFYLSEISISDGHGGGISLQRVLGDDVGLIGQFLHLSRFADEVPPTPLVRARSRTVLGPCESDRSRRWLGYETSDWLFRHRWGTRFHGRVAAREMAGSVRGGRGLRLLVCPQKAVSLRAVEELKRVAPVRYITWFMDDHLVSRRNGRWVYPRDVRRDMGRHLREASTVFVISPALGALYEREFGVASEVLFSPADPGGEAMYEPPSGEGPLTIGYFGRVWEWQLHEIIQFASALRQGREVLHIYSPDTAFHDQLRLPTIELKGGLPPADVSGQMRHYDAVLVPIGFGDGERNLTEFNIATKLSECLTSGTPTIVYGPAHAAMVKLLHGSGAAYVLTGQDLRDWPSVAGQLKNVEERRAVLDAAGRFARDHASFAIMRSRWHRAVERLA